MRDIQVRNQVECVGPHNSFAACFVTRTNSLAQPTLFIRKGAVPHLLVVWVFAELAMLKKLARFLIKDRKAVSTIESGELLAETGKFCHLRFRQRQDAA
jgi:hypothetical protein